MPPSNECTPLITNSYTTKFNIRNVGDAPPAPELGVWQMNARYLGTGFTSTGSTASNENAQMSWGAGSYSAMFDLTPGDYQPVVGGGPHFTYSIDLGNTFTMRPIEIAFDASVTAFTGTGIGQLSLYIYAKHKTIPDTFVVVLWNMFDNRWDDYERYDGNDTYVDFTSMPIHDMSATRMEKTPYAKKHYSVHITRERWATFTSQPMEEFDLLLTGFLQEGFIEGGATLRLGAEVDNIKIVDIGCDSVIAGDDQHNTFDYLAFFGGKETAHGVLMSGGAEASRWRINALSQNSMSICWKNGSTEFFNWDDSKIYQTGWKDSSEYSLAVTKVTLTENGTSSVIATSGPQIYAMRRKNTPYTLTTEGTIIQAGTGVTIQYIHTQEYGAPRVEDNSYLGPRQAVPMRETWADNNGGGPVALKLDRVVTYARDTGPAYTISQTHPSFWRAETSEVGDGSGYACPY